MLFEEKKYNENGRDCSSFGAFPSDSKIWFKLTCDTGKILNARLDIHNDGYSAEPVYLSYEMKETWHENRQSAFECELDFLRLLADSNLSGEGLYYYHYSITTEDGYLELGGEKREELTYIENGEGERQLLLHKPDYRTSSSFREGVVYQIFVDRFFRSGKSGVKKNAILNEDWDNGIPQYAEVQGGELENNMFFGGDLWGIAEKIDYIASLGTKTIYLSPVFDAYSNHKYDTGDYSKVDEMFGGDEALGYLCSEARKRNIDVILDGVFNHTGNDSRYFNAKGTYNSLGAYQSKESPFYHWYSFNEYPDKYESWWGIKILPRVKSGDRSFRDYITREIVPKWMNAGVSGWRLDVADELDDSLLDDLRVAVKARNPDGVIIGEVWEDASDKASYGMRRRYLRGEQLDSVMNYPLRNAVIAYVTEGDHELFRAATETLYRRYPKQSSDNLLNFLGTHDTERIVTVLSGISSDGKSNDQLANFILDGGTKKRAVALLKFAYSLIAALPGVPCVFYGDEAGLEGYHDPFCRRPFPWNNVNEELTAHYIKIGNIRKTHRVLYDGTFKLLEATPERITYVREPWEEGSEKIVVAAARSGDYHIHFPTTAVRLDNNEMSDSFTVKEGEVLYFSLPFETTK